MTEAKAAADRAIDLDGSNLRALEARGIVRLATGDPRGALDDLDRALGLDPASLAIRYQRGKARQALGRPKLAEEDYTAVLEEAPGEPHAWLGRASVRLVLRNPEGAAADASAAIERGEPVRGRLIRSVAYERLGQTADAIADLESAIPSMAPGRDRTAAEAKLEALRGHR